jgi:hypothetical protein
MIASAADTFSDVSTGVFYLLGAVGVVVAGVLAFRRFRVALPDDENWHAEGAPDARVRRYKDGEVPKFLYEATVRLKNVSNSRQTIDRIRGRLVPGFEYRDFPADSTPDDLNRLISKGTAYGTSLAPGASHVHHVYFLSEEFLECFTLFWGFDYWKSAHRGLSTSRALACDWGWRTVMIDRQDIQAYGERAASGQPSDVGRD